MGGFGVLVGLVGIVLVIAFIMMQKSKSEAAGGQEKAGGGAEGNMASRAPEIQQGIDEETVAAIMAAVSCMVESASGVRYAVRSISRANSERPVWGFAGVQQNTRPF